MADDNLIILQRLRGMPATPGTPETDADPNNPNVRPLTVAELAEIAFNSQETVRALEMANTPTDYDERKKAFVRLAEARAAAAKAKKDLENATT